MTTSTSVERRRRLACRTLLSLSTILAGLAVPALAQNVGDDGGGSAPSTHYTPPADRLLISPGGVDLRTGRYAFNETDLLIGSDDQPGKMTFSRIMSTNVVGHAEPFGNLTHNWDMMILSKRIDITGHNYHNGSGPDYWVSVRAGGVADTFTMYGGGYAGLIHTSQAQDSVLTYTGPNAGTPLNYTYQKGDGTTFTFRPINGQECSTYYQCAYVSTMTLATGEVFSFNYENFAPGIADGVHLKSVISSTGYGLNLDYVGNPHTVSAACVVNLSQQILPPNCSGTSNGAAYTFNTSNGTRLASAVSPAGKETYTYDGSAGPGMAMTRGDDAQPWLINEIGNFPGEDGAFIPAVQQQTFADGRSYSYDYQDNPNRRDDDPPQNYSTGYTDGQGRQTIVKYDFVVDPVSGNSFNDGPDPHPPINLGSLTYVATPGPARVIDPDGNETKYNYCDRNAEENSHEEYKCYMFELQDYTMPDGEKVELYYDNMAAHTYSRVRRIAAPDKPAPDINTYETHVCNNRNPACTKPTSSTDALGHTTTFVYDTAHGGVRRETDPAGDDGIQAVKRYSYVQRSAQVSDGNGGYVALGAPIWLLASVKTCQKTATTTESYIDAQTCTGGASDEVVTTYDYGPTTGPSTLLLHGLTVSADGETHRTCYRYDDKANRIATTTAGAGLTSCP